MNYRSQLKKGETKFLVNVDGVMMTLVDLLGDNRIGQQQYSRAHHEKKMRTKLPQAFLTAGEKFEAISNDYKVNIIVPYEPETSQLLDELSQVNIETEKKKILRKLQRYTVGISEARKNRLGNAIYENNEGVLILCDSYYDKKVGVIDEPILQLYNM